MFYFSIYRDSCDFDRNAEGEAASRLTLLPEVLGDLGHAGALVDAEGAAFVAVAAVDAVGGVIRRIPLHDARGHAASEYYAFWPKGRGNALVSEFASILVSLFADAD